MMEVPYYQDEWVTIYHGDCREVIPQLPPFDLVLTDPPYGTEARRGGYARSKKKIANDTDVAVVGEALSLARARMTNGYAVTFCSAANLVAALKLFPGVFMGEMIWSKGQPGLLSVVNLPAVRGEEHPHAKPVALWYEFMKLPGAMILDPFMGTGSVVRAAKDLGRRAVGIELNERWCERAAERLSQEVLNLPTAPETEEFEFA